MEKRLAIQNLIVRMGITKSRQEFYRENPNAHISMVSPTARTMIETVEHLKIAGMKPPICIGIHAIFSGNAYQELMDTGVNNIVTCNTIPHPSNAIDLSNVLAKEVKQIMDQI